MPVILSAIPTDDKVAALIKTFASFMSKVKYYPIDELSNPGNKFDQESVVQDGYYRQLLSSKSGEAPGLLSPSTCLRLVHTFLTDQQKINDLLDFIGRNGLKLIDDIKVESLTSAAKEIIYFIHFKLGQNLGNGDRLFKYSDLSLGTRRILQILVSLVFDDSSVMLIEHPEDGVHSGLLGNLVAQMDTAKNPTQIILTSHSAALLNKMKPEDIRMVQLIGQNTSSIRSLTVGEIDGAKKFMNEEGTLFEYIGVIEQE
jgi:hypothetical protein